MGRLISPVQKIAHRMQREITRIDLAFADPVELHKASVAVLSVVDLVKELVAEMQKEVDEHYAHHTNQPTKP